MKKLLTICLLLLLSVAGIQAKTWRLVWHDEFDRDGAPDTTRWIYEHGFVRNEEAQWYQPDNVTCRDGYLVIEGRREKKANPWYEAGSEDWRKNRPEAEYTSGSINTCGKFEFLYGRVEVRAKIPTAPGAWPAIWFKGLGAPWPSNGEIDLMEYYRIDGVPHILANACWGSDRPHTAVWNARRVPFSHFTDRDRLWAERFHVWRMDWDEEHIRLYLDDELLNDIPMTQPVNGKDAAEGVNPFTRRQFLLLNLAMGGMAGGPIDDDALPLRYYVDYVRVYQ